MAYFATIFYLFMAQYALVLSADSSSWKDSDLGFLLQNKRTHQLQDRDSNVDFKTRLDDIADTLKSMQGPCTDPSDGPAHGKVTLLEAQVKSLTDEVAEVKEKLVEKGCGTTYTRWGRTVCPKTGSELVYSGYAGGSHFSHMGGAASMLCLSRVPQWGRYNDRLNTFMGYIYGAEYEDAQEVTDKLFDRSHLDQDVPCAVCNLNSRSSVIMIPGRKSCFPGWTIEYTGYLMTGRHTHHSTDYYCIDGSPEDIHGGKANHNGYLLYFVESRCGSLRCPPYVEGRELTCVVCTK